MSIKFVKSCLVTVALLVISSCAFGPGAGISELKIVENPKDIPGLVEDVRGSIGRHFMLDRLRNDPTTLDGGFKYLVTDSISDIIRETLNQWSIVYGADFTIEYQKETLRVFIFAGKPDFSGDFVYAVSQLGYRWPVFLHGRK